MGSQRESCVHSRTSSPRTSLENLGTHEDGMYRIELSPGEETVFRSIEELAVAIKRGVVTPRAHIFHSASNRWLPIQFHPHYKAALSMPLTQAKLVAGPPVKPLSSLSLKTPPEPEPATLPSPPAAFTAPVEAPARRKPARSEQSSRKSNRRSGKPRRQLRIALVGALLIGGAQWVLSVPLFSRAEAPVLARVQRHLIAMPTEAMQRVSSPNSAAMMPVLPSHPASSASVQLEGISEAYPNQAPSFGGTATAANEVPEIAQSPSSLEVGSAPALSADSVNLKAADSSSAKALKGILRSVSGARPPGKAPSSR
jgi:hypothetical protein